MKTIWDCALRMILRGALSLILLTTLGGPSASAGGPMAADGQSGVKDPDRPIAADVFANPRGFVGKQVAIYGLVIKETDNRSGFWLQDVSERPILVTIPPGRRLHKDDQVLVRGKVVMRAGVPVIRATSIEFTKVLGGGCGC